MPVGHGGVQDVDVDLQKLFSSLGRNKLRIAIVVMAATALAYFAATHIKPKYRAEAHVIIERQESIFTRPDKADSGDSSMLDAEGVRSQVQVIGSTELLKKVIDQLGLASLPEFDGQEKPTALDAGLAKLGLKNNSVAISPDERVLNAVRDHLTIYQVDGSRVIVIQFSSHDPALAEKVPNAIADAYLTLQREAKFESNSDATKWLEPEINDLRERVKDAEAKVADYRASADLLVGSSNTVLATQQLSDLSQELSRVQASRAETEARAKAIKEALDRHAPVETIPEVLNSPLIQRLRERQVELQAQIAQLSVTLLDKHPRLKELRSQLGDYDRQIQVEARKVLASFQGDLDTARLRENELQDQVNALKARSAQAGEQEVELKALERDAASERQLLDSYLTKYREAASRRERNYLPVDARVFSRAIEPSEPYFPKTIPIVGAGFAGSLLLMILFTLVRELFSGRAMVPAGVPQPQSITQVAMPSSDGSRTNLANPLPASSHNEDLARKAAYDPTGHRVDRVAKELIYAKIKRALVVSPEGDSGAAVTVLLAREIADSGARVLLLDLSEGGVASKPMLDNARLPGISDLLASQAQFSDVIHGDYYSNCHIIPIGTADPERASRGIERLPIILDSLETAYDIVLIECGNSQAGGLSRLVNENARMLVSVMDPSDPVIPQTVSKLRLAGMEGITVVTPLDYLKSKSVKSKRSVA